MPQHVDRQKSKDAIKKKVAEEKKRIEDLKKRKAEREKEGRPTDDLDIQIQNEQESIKGKEEILDIVDDFGQVRSVDAAIKSETTLLDDGKKELARLRRLEPKPRRKIEKLERDLERLSKRIAGKKKAKDALVFD